MVEINICNVPVSFPMKPYMSQMSMMTRIINSLNKKENCLLELPTGSGKTMALLCATLAWHNAQAESDADRSPDIEMGYDIANSKPNGKKTKRPQIFFCSRTHKQIGQVVRELKKSAYSGTKMSILGSRKQLCVNDHILESKNLEESCRDLCLNQEGGCYFKFSDTAVQPQSAFDMESIKITLKNRKICPYFELNHWSRTAHLVLCPYNYILDPKIRKTMGIELSGAVIILDEAHNVEDICRDAGSISISQQMISAIKHQVEALLQHEKIQAAPYKCLIKYFEQLSDMITTLSKKLFFKDDDVLKKVWSSDDFLAAMRKHKLDLEDIQEFNEKLTELASQAKELSLNHSENEQPSSYDSTIPNISSIYLNQFESFFMVAETLFDEQTNILKDFRMVITEGERFKPIEDQSETHEAWKNTLKRKSGCLISNFILNLWCMNPGIIFKKLEDKTHSIILTSGTLSPMTSFDKELDCKFHTILEAPHVVGNDQTLLASIGQGPRGIELQAVYKNTNQLAFQDELGRMIQSCCQVVPNGILCFVSSFALLENLIKRWTQIKLIREIEKYKTIFIEPRNTTDMDQCMKSYYKNIKTGALLFAVFRGKASEGMDFADDAARLVITVGIPYPSAMDPKILLKKDYNTIENNKTDGKTSNLRLTGGEWYTIQAYRALNQAIGRCIRHRNDWGAMIMVDSRFANDHYSTGLCKWIKHRKVHFTNWNDLYHDLQEFVLKHSSKKPEVITIDDDM